MGNNKSDKLKHLFKIWPLHTISTARWLSSENITYSNIEKYIHSEWIKRIGGGAYQRVNDRVEWEGAVFGLQKQYPATFYVGGRTALELQGSAHFIPLGKPTLYLFTTLKQPVPLWFRNYIQILGNSCIPLQYGFLPPQLALTTFNCGEFEIQISSRERASLEMVELLGKFHSFEECFLVFENLINLRPRVIQELLEKCTSIKAKRIFLFLGARLEHKWIQELNLERINLGNGPRDITPGGYYDKEFKITYPKGLFGDDTVEI